MLGLKEPRLRTVSRRLRTSSGELQMVRRNHAAHVILMAVLVGAAGCAGVDRMGTKMDMAAGRLGEPGKHEYEGQLQSVKRVGPMTALQFSDGQFFDVSEAPAGLVQGDVVRI